MIRYQWSALRQAQVLRFYEHYVQMTLAMHDLEVYTPPESPRGVTLLTRPPRGEFVELNLQVVRDFEALPLPRHFTPRPRLYLAVGLLVDGEEPQSLLIPSGLWTEPGGLAPVCITLPSGALELQLHPAHMRSLCARFAMGAMLTQIRHRPAPQALQAVDGSFWRTALRDSCLFAPEPMVLAQVRNLPPAQQQLVRLMAGAQLPVTRQDDVRAFMQALDDLMQWDERSARPQAFAGKLLFLLEYLGQDADWFRTQWLGAPHSAPAGLG